MDMITIPRREYELLLSRHRPTLYDHMDDILAMRQAGATLQVIATKYGVSRERVRQLLAETKKEA